jgi:hypothetical protein
MHRPLAALVASLLATPVARGAPTIGYAQATGYFKQDDRPTLYQPLNLLDGRDATAWCSPTGDPLNELLSFGFSAPVRLEELRVTTGNNFDAATFASFARAKKLLVRAGKEQRALELQDLRGPQVLRVDPPLTGARFRVEVLDQYPADDPDQPVCLTDLVFVSGGKALNGPWLAPRLKYERAAAALLGTWYAGYEGGPDRFLTFNFDGSFRATLEPFDPAQTAPRALEGTYDAGGSRVVFVVRGRRYPVGVSRQPRKGGGTALVLDGEVPAELKGPWRSVP